MKVHKIMPYPVTEMSQNVTFPSHFLIHKIGKFHFSSSE